MEIRIFRSKASFFFLFFLFHIGLPDSFGQGVIWNEGSWESVLQNARNENKLILVDIYTTWCWPCIEMDQTVFPDSAVGRLYNSQFIPVKLNAEDNGEGSEVARTYGATAYPTLLYVDGNGNLISSFVGLKNKYEMIELGSQNLELFGQVDYLNDIKANTNAVYDQQELERILNISRIHPFDGKEKIAMKYMDGLTNISEKDLRLVMSEIDEMDLVYLERLSPLTTSLSYSDLYLRRNSKEWIQWKTNTERAIYNHLERYKSKADFSKYERTLAILKEADGQNERKVDNLYLDYYKRNDLSQYRTFATYVIDEYIIPTRPQEVKKADEEKFRMLQNELKKDMEASFGASFADALPTNDDSNSPTIDSLSEIYTISKTIADQLYEISGDFFALYEDESSQRKARFWASLSHEYYPYDSKYFENHIFILEATGHPEEAQKVRQLFESLPWYQEMVASKSF